MAQWVLCDDPDMMEDDWATFDVNPGTGSVSPVGDDYDPEEDDAPTVPAYWPANADETTPKEKVSYAVKLDRAKRFHSEKEANEFAVKVGSFAGYAVLDDDPRLVKADKAIREWFSKHPEDDTSKE